MNANWVRCVGQHYFRKRGKVQRARRRPRRVRVLFKNPPNCVREHGNMNAHYL